MMNEKALADVPSLDSLVADPGLVQTLPCPVIQHILIQITSLLPLLVSQSYRVPTTEKGHQDDRLLSIDEAASILGKTKDWLYRHSDTLPFTVREGRLLRFSSNGIQKYIRARLRQG
jgi:predicted DNA-binding transcriptional regulator AlpA